MAVKPSTVRVLPRLLFMLVFASLLSLETADALQLTRNGKTFAFDVELPHGLTFKNKGVDRILTYRGVEISVRLIQDGYADCGQLVSERESRMWERAGYVPDAGTVISKRECRIYLHGEGGGTDSTYTYLEVCKCYAAMHVSYPNGADFNNAANLVSALAKALASRPEIAPNASVAEMIDPDWKEAFGIFRKRNLSAQLAYDIYSQSVTSALQTERESKAVLAYLAGQFGVSEKRVQSDFSGGIDWIFDVESGVELNGMSPQDIARSISSCYSRGHPSQHCKLNYHQELGCLMTPKWVRLCSAPYSRNVQGTTDLCWGEPRGDMPMLPVVSENAERSVELPKASKGGQVKIAKLAKKPTKVAVPFCDDNIWRSFYAERGNAGIPSGLLP